MDEVQAAFLDVKLKHLDKENEQRRMIAAYYAGNISNHDIILPAIPENVKEHVWHLFVIRSVYRDELQDFLTGRGIEALIHYPVPPHKQNAYKRWNGQSYPITEKIHGEVLSVPLNSGLKDFEVRKVASILNTFKR